MKVVTTSQKILDLWIELLDDSFTENLKNTPPPKMVCKSHFLRTHDGKIVYGALPRTEEYTHFMEKPKQWVPEESIILDNVSCDLYGLHSYSRISRKINYGKYVDTNVFQIYFKNQNTTVNKYMKNKKKLSHLKPADIITIDQLSRDIYDLHSYSYISRSTTDREYIMDSQDKKRKRTSK